MSYLGPYPKVGAGDVLDELRRELKMRESCYPDWVRQGKYSLTRAVAAHRIAVLRHAISLLEAQQPTQTTLF